MVNISWRWSKAGKRLHSEVKSVLWSLIKSVLFHTWWKHILWVLFPCRISRKQVMCCYYHMLAPVVWNSKQTTLHSRAHCRITQPLTGRAQKCLSFSRDKYFLHWFGERMNSQGDERKQTMYKVLLFCPSQFSISKCASILNIISSALNNTGCLTSERQWSLRYKTQWGMDSGARLPGCLSFTN